MFLPNQLFFKYVKTDDKNGLQTTMFNAKILLKYIEELPGNWRQLIAYNCEYIIE